ncbi:conserved hypothetical protein [Cenarchaeum symbiosum A]|uniref:DUF8203 domain-containing protein n=1 Tax=Cenarchaeum symbiosum (strain A) TaxID=414004 RepID=A0RV72_CENSY|nr:conserved hypothetical protein [Cenarchaeum symbiosum A]
MTIVGFDSKQFTRGKTQYASAMGKDYRYHGFNTQLGVGVSTEQPERFVEEYVSLNEKLKEGFGISRNALFFSSRHLENSLGVSKAASFADQLIAGMQEHIKSVHFSYVILSRSSLPRIMVGGLQHYKKIMPTDAFIDNLGPMFSYLTAHSFLWMRGYKNAEKVELHINSFRSKFTPAWNQIIDNTEPKIFIKGNECNPYISCASIIAFLTDVKLRRQMLDLNVENLGKIWAGHSFDTSTQFFDKKNIPYYSWKDNSNINITGYLARPVIFLSVDKMELENGILKRQRGRILKSQES